ncbi:hypothetical protein HHX47_DHR1001077 [Lentinula edodes]|nr:hypothetical protein HHX47_DHR1001077 [Lentinula edodes]
MGRSFAFPLRSVISLSMRSMHSTRSMTLSSDDCSLRVRVVSSMALPRMVGRRDCIVAWAKEYSWYPRNAGHGWTLTLVGVLGHGALMFFLLGRWPSERVTREGASAPVDISKL